MPFLIDGHNVIAALEDIDLEDPHDEAKLVMKLRAWAARIGRKAIVVFDGGIPGGLSRSLSTNDVQVVFAARQHTNADRIIRERLRDLPDAPNWTVVSSDREILDVAADIEARTLTAQDFADLLERPPGLEKEKPDAISAAEVEAWLQVFQDPDDEAPPAPPPIPPTKETSRRRQKLEQRRSESGPPSQRRHTRAIGEQIGIDLPPAPPEPEPTDKPTEISEDEVEAWLEVFHDDPNRRIPPPDLPPRQERSESPKQPVVRKEGELSSDEVETWLSVFGKDETRQPDKTKSQTASRKQGSKLNRHQSKLAPAEDTAEVDLPEEDVELWHRLFGDNE
ncbi:MAG: NYN domain-containing protein [Anaerolineae bacterium]